MSMINKFLMEALADEEVDELYKRMLDSEMVSEETLQCITSINGYSIETLNDVLYWATGCKTWKEFEDQF